ncbi:MAG: NnrU family protein [Gammaproteobacteria bacterium]|jgi:uncharacterized membrane protein
MLLLILGLVLFLGMHSVSIAAEGFRDRMAAKSEIGWKAFYGVVSIAGIYLIVKGYADARLDPVVLYVPPVWLKHLAALLLLPVFVLFFAPYFPGRIKSATGHPQLVAVKLWAVAHLLVNGTLADVILFGSFLAWAVVDRISMKRRTQRPIPSAPPRGINDVLLVFAGLGVYVTFVLWLHQAWFGVAPFG